MRWYGRLSRAREIVRVRRLGRRLGLATFASYSLPAGRGPCRFAITVSKAVGSAVARNLVRRRLKGALDELPPLVAPAHLVLVVKPGAAQLPYRQLAADAAVALDRLRAV